jgi:hypothetical protein
MEIKYRAHRLGDKSGQRRSGKDTVEANFGAKSQQPLSPLMRLLWGLGLLVLILGGLLCYLIFHSKSPDGTVAPQTAAAPKWQGPQPQQIAEKFLAASTQEERLRWVREPAAVAEIMERFYRDGPGATEQQADLKVVSSAITASWAVQQFTVRMTDGSNRQLYVPFDESGGQVDFKCYAGYCSEPWDKLLDGTVAEAAEMRVGLKLADYYNYDFADEKQWQCLAATAPELPEPIYLYVRRDSPAMKEIATCSFTVPMRYTVAIEIQGESYKRRQWLLSRVICGSWVTP